MKKLLLILICLFVSFEIKSEEKVLSCLINESSVSNHPPDLTIYLDVDEKWLNTLPKKDWMKKNNNKDLKYVFSVEDDCIHLSKTLSDCRISNSFLNHYSIRHCNNCYCILQSCNHHCNIH